MATSREQLERQLVEVRRQIQAGIDIERNRQRERYLVERLRQLDEKEKR
jgi:hypothetical protein